MISVDYLLTTVGKTKQELKKIVSQLNIKGRLLIGNQGSKEEKITSEVMFDCEVTIFDMVGYGVSKNRNRLLMASRNEYVTFLDDDMYYEKENQQKIETIVDQNRDNAVRFNVISDNKERPIKTLKKQCHVGFRKLSSYGVWGIFFKREFLIKNNIFFNEKIGPGTEINHGEDGVFIRNFTKYSKVFCVPPVAFHAKQSESTWHDNARNLEKELFSHGYNYYLIYEKKAQIMSVIFLATHMNCYPKGTKYGTLREYMKKGIKKAMEESK